MESPAAQGLKGAPWGPDPSPPFASAGQRQVALDEPLSLSVLLLYPEGQAPRADGLFLFFLFLLVSWALRRPGRK